MRKFLLSTLVMVTGLSLLTGIALAEETVIAFYTLNQTPADLTGINPDVEIVNAPYEEDGVYLNGKYVGSDPDGSKVHTPQVTLLDFSALSVRVEFKIGEVPSTTMPILFCGASWRWMGASLATSGGLFLNYHGYSGPISAETVTPGDWHTLAMTHDGTTGHLLLDGVEVASQDFVPNHHEERRFVTHNGSNGLAFKGHIRNLVVYNGVVQFVSGVVGDETPGAVRILRNYPNPFNPATTIAFSLPEPATTSLEVFDLTGRFVQSLLRDEMLGQGPHEHVWSGTDMPGRLIPSRTYFYRLEAGNFSETKRMTMLK